ncbi:MAG TPA: contact-dependent growth inhibition system immunity protein [Flavobacteriales bacterium]|nr:contact-dependent growth inhibition system immunity protein [Flavobacteriales bacterium]
MEHLHHTLTTLENKDWGPPTAESHLVTECHRLRHAPLKDLTTEDLRLLIGQEIGLPFLVPLALDHLSENPWAEGHMYPGDLLKAVVAVSPSFWQENPELVPRVQSVLDKIERRWKFYYDEVRPTWIRIFGGA